MPDNTPSSRALLTIGVVAQATGIPTNTLRTWERRYGFPVPERTEAGQRLYRQSVVEHLRLVSRALSEGHRARQALTLEISELQRLVGESRAAPAAGAVHPEWVAAVKRLDGGAFTRLLNQESARLGALPLLEARIGPFLTWIGTAWRSGEIDVHHEHFASDHLRSHLDRSRRALSPSGPTDVICATLPDEQHDLGVLMCAVAVASGGRRPMVLPGTTPPDVLARAADQTRCRQVAISLSQNSYGEASNAQLRRLRELLPTAVGLWVGGAGAPLELQGAVLSTSLSELAGAR